MHARENFSFSYSTTVNTIPRAVTNTLKMACQDPYVSSLHKQFNAVPLKTPDSRFAPCTVSFNRLLNEINYLINAFIRFYCERTEIKARLHGTDISKIFL